MSIKNYKGQKMKTKKKEEGVTALGFVFFIFSFAILGHSLHVVMNATFDMEDKQIKEKFGGYPAEILKPVTLKLLPDLIDKDTKGIVFVKRGCLSASRDELETLRDKNSSDKDVYIIGGHPVKIEVKICGE